MIGKEKLPLEEYDMNVRQFFSHWDEVRDGLEKMLISLETNDLDVRPSNDAMTIGDILRHIAGAEVHWIQKVIMANWETNARFSREDYPSKKEILKLLKLTHLPTIKLLDSMSIDDLERVHTNQGGERFTVFWVLWHTLEHEIHHKGQIFRDLRILGHPARDTYGP